MNNVPNTKVWLLGKEYQEAAEALEQELKLWPAAILSALAIEIFLKSFSAKRNRFGFIKTNHGHTLKGLFNKISADEQASILAASKEINPSVDLMASLNKFNDLFTAARYRYEESSVSSVGNDIVHFSRHLCETVFLLGKRRGV